jgi:hypothetical protein
MTTKCLQQRILGANLGHESVGADMPINLRRAAGLGFSHFLSGPMQMVTLHPFTSYH